MNLSIDDSIIQTWLEGSIPSSEITQMFTSAIWDIPVQHGYPLLFILLKNNKKKMFFEAIHESQHFHILDHNHYSLLRFAIYSKRTWAIQFLLSSPLFSLEQENLLVEGPETIPYELMYLGDLSLCKKWNSLHPFPNAVCFSNEKLEYDPYKNHFYNASEAALILKKNDIFLWLLEQKIIPRLSFLEIKANHTYYDQVPFAPIQMVQALCIQYNNDDYFQTLFINKDFLKNPNIYAQSILGHLEKKQILEACDFKVLVQTPKKRI